MLAAGCMPCCWGAPVGDCRVVRREAAASPDSADEDDCDNSELNGHRLVPPPPPLLFAWPIDLCMENGQTSAPVTCGPEDKSIALRASNESEFAIIKSIPLLAEWLSWPTILIWRRGLLHANSDLIDLIVAAI